jgi:hypothetical protein
MVAIKGRVGRAVFIPGSGVDVAPTTEVEGGAEVATENCPQPKIMKLTREMSKTLIFEDGFISLQYQSK